MSTQRPHTEAELIELMHAVDVRAPEELHRRVQALVAEHGAEPARRAARPTLGPLRLGGAIAALGVFVAVLVLVLADSAGTSAPSVRQASTLALSAATMPAPGESAHARGTLTVAVDGLPFPYWDGRFGWRAIGARVDRLDGRAVRTVFYANARGQRIGYAILAGSPAPAVGGGAVAWRAGTPYRLLSEHGIDSVVWLREGHLCVVAGRGVASSTLLALASWREPASVS